MHALTEQIRGGGAPLHRGNRSPPADRVIDRDRVAEFIQGDPSRWTGKHPTGGEHPGRRRMAAAGVDVGESLRTGLTRLKAMTKR